MTDDAKDLANAIAKIIIESVDAECRGDTRLALGVTKHIADILHQAVEAHGQFERGEGSAHEILRAFHSVCNGEKS